MRKRTRARELALQLLYQADLIGELPDEAIRHHLERFSRDDEVRAYAEALVRGTRERQAAIDLSIAGVALNWDLGRMAVVDRNIIRMAIFEMRHGGIAPRVAIDEAIELAKRYSTRNSGAFVNGILDRLKSDDAPGDPPAGRAEGRAPRKGKAGRSGPGSPPREAPPTAAGAPPGERLVPADEPRPGPCLDHEVVGGPVGGLAGGVEAPGSPGGSR